MDALALNSRTLVLSTAPHNFAGAGAAHARTLELLASVGATTQFWVPNEPFRVKELEGAGVEVTISSVTSDAYPNSDSVIYGSVAEALVRTATRWLEERPDNRVVLFATYLFPFCAAVEMAARILFRFRERVDCVLNPAGSDIWQIGRQMPHVARQLIDSQYVTAVVTYSECFAREIQANIGCDRVIDVIPPAIDIEKFRPLSAPDRTAARQSLGIAQGDFVIVHCSNHRPVKGLSHLVELASHFASRRDEVIHLIMIGPITSHLSEVVKLAGLPEPGDVLPYHAQLGNLRIACTGLRHDVHRLQAIGDVAVNTSLHDSFNISLAEAMACQIPPLTTDVAGIASTIRAYDCGGTIPFENNPVYSDNAISLTGQSIIRVDAAVAWLENIASDPEGRLAFGKRARQAIVATCSDSVVARKWSELVGLR